MSLRKNIFVRQYVTGYYEQSLAEAFLNPKNFQLDIVTTVCLSIQSARLLCQIKTDLYFHYYMKILQRVKSCSMQQYGKMKGQTDAHNNAMLSALNNFAVMIKIFN